MARTIAVVLKGYPRLSETFIAQEIRGLEEHGLHIRIVSLRQPTDRHVHPVHREIEAPCLYLPEYLHKELARVWRGWRHARRLPGYRAARHAWLRDLARDPTPNRVRRFGQALVLVRELPADVGQLHAHFLHTPASVARYASLATGLPWTCSAHARDIWTSPAWEKRRKLAEVRWVVTCTAANRDHLRALAPGVDRVELVYHGLDLRRFPAAPDRLSTRDGARRDAPVRLLSVGRAVEKKGYDDLLDALARLPDGLHWELEHVGGGPLRRRLERRAEHLGLASRIRWLGARPQEDVLAAYARSDLFVLASRVAKDGDRDGLPNVLMEAQSQGLACVTTRISGIGEFIEDGVNGLLVPQRDPAALGTALGRLIRDPAQRQRLGEAGNRRVRTAFSFAAGVERIAQRLSAEPGP